MNTVELQTEERRYLVTGGSRGLGLRFCRHYLEGTTNRVVSCARRATEDRLRSTEPAREMVLHAAPQPSAAVRHSDDLSVASLVNTHRAEAPALKQQRPVQRSRKPKSLPPYLRVVK